MHIIHRDTKPATTRQHRRPTEAKASIRPPVWRPQASGLTRDELRAIVLEALG